MTDTSAVHQPHGRTEKQKQVMRQIEKDGVDPFDWQLLSKYHDKPVLRKSQHWIVTENDYPYEGTSLHLLLIYRERVRSLIEVSQDAFTDLHSMLGWIESTYALTHGTILFRFGEMQYSGGSVDHLHMHVIVGGTDLDNEKLKVSIGYKK